MIEISSIQWVVRSMYVEHRSMALAFLTTLAIWTEKAQSSVTTAVKAHQTPPSFYAFPEKTNKSQPSKFRRKARHPPDDGSPDPAAVALFLAMESKADGAQTGKTKDEGDEADEADDIDTLI